MQKLVPDILFVINDFNFLKSHRLSLIKFLSKQGLNVIICTDCTDASESDIKVLKRSNIQLIDFKLSRSSTAVFKNLYSLIQLHRITSKYKPRILSLVSAKPIVLGGLLSLVCNFEKVYFFITGLGYVFINQSFKARFIRTILLCIYKLVFLKKNCRVIFQNKDDLDLFLSKKLVTKVKSIIIPGNGIDTEDFKSERRPSDKVRFLFASRLLIDKGINEFFKASKSIGTNKASFKIVGELDKENPNCISNEFFKEIENSSFISYAKKVEHETMPQLLSNSDVFVLPSYREGLPQVALEAASCNMPLILTDVEGCRECLNENLNGYLVRKGDHKDLENKMRIFLNNPSLISKMGQESRKYITEKFSKEKIYNSLLELYSS